MSAATRTIVVLHDCGGEWIPQLQWVGRYRCSGCGAFGHRQRVVTRGARGRGGEIVPYKCGLRVDGLRCGGNAVAKDEVSISRAGVPVREWRCSQHRVNER